MVKKETEELKWYSNNIKVIPMWGLAAVELENINLGS